MHLIANSENGTAMYCTLPSGTPECVLGASDGSLTAFSSCLLQIHLKALLAQSPGASPRASTERTYTYSGCLWPQQPAGVEQAMDAPGQGNSGKRWFELRT
jgi:hypothetical protein